MKMKIRLPLNLSTKIKNVICVCFFRSAGLSFSPLFLSRSQASVSLFESVCATCSRVLVLVSQDLFVWPAYPGKLQMLFGAIINLRNSSATDPFSNSLEMSLLLGLPYIRVPYYFKLSSLCILHLHMDSSEAQKVQKEKGLTCIFLLQQVFDFIHHQHFFLSLFTCLFLYLQIISQYNQVAVG